MFHLDINVENDFGLEICIYTLNNQFFAASTCWKICYKYMCKLVV